MNGPSVPKENRIHVKLNQTIFASEKFFNLTVSILNHEGGAGTGTAIVHTCELICDLSCRDVQISFEALGRPFELHGQISPILWLGGIYPR
jgi:hypothetical protein